MLTIRSTCALGAIVALGLCCAACTTGGSSYGGAAPADARNPAAQAAPATATPARVYRPEQPPDYSSGTGGGGGGMGY
jgi:hypothetical protein